MAKKHWSENEKLELVMATLRNESSKAALCRQRNVTPGSLDEWIRRFLESGKQGLQSKRTAGDNAEVVALRRENEELKSALGEAQVELALEEAARLGLRVPATIEIELGAVRTKILTDNGPAMISKAFKKFAAKAMLQHLRTKNQRPETNGCIERFHGTLKYEKILGAMYPDPITAAERINRFRTFYNEERIHQSLDYKTPLEVINEWLHNQPEIPARDSGTYIHAA